MNKSRFKDLLMDLYEKYNPDHIKYVDELVSRNYESPFAAVDSIFLKYNHKSMSHFDPEKSTDEYKVKLIKDYEDGLRTFKDIDLSKEASIRKQEEENERSKEQLEASSSFEKKTTEVVEKTLSSVDDTVRKAMSSINGEVDKRINEEIEKMNERISKATDVAVQEAKRSHHEGVDYQVTIDNIGEEVILPNKRHLASLGLNARLIVRSKSGKPIGLIIKDIAYDSFTSDREVIVSIHLEKG